MPSVLAEVSWNHDVSEMILNLESSKTYFSLRGHLFLEITQSHGLPYSPNKHACLNKRALDFSLWLVISQTVLNRSESYFQHLTLRCSGVHPVNLSAIRQSWGFISCLRARRVYLVKYGILNTVDEFKFRCTKLRKHNSPFFRENIRLSSAKFTFLGQT